MPCLTLNMFQVSGQASNILCMWLAAEFKFVHANGMFNAKSESLCVACHERKCLRIAPCPYHAISGRQSTDLPANLNEKKKENGTHCPRPVRLLWYMSRCLQDLLCVHSFGLAPHWFCIHQFRHSCQTLAFSHTVGFCVCFYEHMLHTRGLVLGSAIGF
jgi:hypothetical protein